MCGIAGLLDAEHRTSADALGEVAAAMAGTLRHRGPDDCGAWVDAGAGVAFGFRRLAIIDLTSEGAQPMTSADGRWVLVYNGEVYDFADLRAELEGLGVRFRGRSDTEVLVEAIARWGVEQAARRANGMFAFAAWDRRERVLHLARDRMGEKPLYCGWAGRTFVFGSELRALLRHPDVRPKVDDEALGAYLRYGYVPAPRSIYRGIGKVEPGTILSVSAGGATTTTYWSTTDIVLGGVADPLDVGPGEAVDLVVSLLGDSVARRMVSDVPLGAFLSGGTDSSLVVALMQQASATPVRTFTIGFDEPAYDESPMARAVAAHLGTDHTELRVTSAEALDEVPGLAGVADEPLADSSLLPTLLVARMARRDVTVALSGDGGDELFGGYARYLRPAGLRGLERLPSPVRRGVARGLARVPATTWDRLAAGAEPLLPPSLRQSRFGAKVHKLATSLDRDGADDAYLALMTLWSRPPLAGAAPGRDLLPDGWRRPADPVDRRMLLDALTYLPDDLLAKVDRATMAVSLEARVPLLDPRVVELAWKLPRDVKFRDGQGKWVLREALRRYVPATLVDRPKMGFGVPLGAWLRGPLRPWAEDLLDASALAGLLDPAPIRATWAEHLGGERDHSGALWAILAFQSWRAGAEPGVVSSTR